MIVVFFFSPSIIQPAPTTEKSRQLMATNQTLHCLSMFILIKTSTCSGKKGPHEGHPKTFKHFKKPQKQTDGPASASEFLVNFHVFQSPAAPCVEDATQNPLFSSPAPRDHRTAPWRAGDVGTGHSGKSWETHGKRTHTLVIYGDLLHPWGISWENAGKKHHFHSDSSPDSSGVIDQSAVSRRYSFREMNYSILQYISLITRYNMI